MRRHYAQRFWNLGRWVACSLAGLLVWSCGPGEAPEDRPAFARATKILTRHRDVLEDTAKRLLEQETLSEEELPELPPEPGEETKAAE